MSIRPTAKAVEPLPNYRLLVTFDNAERRVFDVKPYINGGWFGKLSNPDVFKSVRIAGLSVEWPEGQDICPDCLYNDSVPEKRA
jgi:hypothetical protein